MKPVTPTSQKPYIQGLLQKAKPVGKVAFPIIFMGLGIAGIGLSFCPFMPYQMPIFYAGLGTLAVSSVAYVGILGGMALKNKLDEDRKKWLSDQDMQDYFVYLSIQNPELHIPLDFYTGCLDTVSDAIKNAPKDKKHLAFYLNLTGKHWTLLYVDREKKTVEYYDSFKNSVPHEVLETSLTQIAEKISTSEEIYSTKIVIEKRVQFDVYHCGYWADFFLIEREKNPHVDFNNTIFTSIFSFFRTPTLIKNHTEEVDRVLKEIREKRKIAAKEELETYKSQFVNEKEAEEKWYHDVNNMTVIERMKMILKGERLKPKVEEVTEEEMDNNKEQFFPDEWQDVKSKKDSKIPLSLDF